MKLSGKRTLKLPGKRTYLAALLGLASLAAASCASSTTSAQSGGGSGSSTGYLSTACAAAKDATRTTGPGLTTWNGPTTGPAGLKNKSVVYISMDQTNEGSATVGVGAEEAAKVLGWRFRLLDGMGTPAGMQAAMRQAIALKPNGILLGSVSAGYVGSIANEATSLGIKLVGWHAVSDPGPVRNPDIFWNVQSNQEQAGKDMADYVICSSGGHAGAAVVTWNIFPIAVLKDQAFEHELARCKGCSLLSTQDIPLTNGTTQMPTYVTGLLQKYGKKLTSVMFINDEYATDSVPALRSAGIAGSGPPTLVSVGDGTPDAFQRIRAGQYQSATVPEALIEAGWQMIDEMNRDFAGAPPSTYDPPVHLIVKSNVNANGGSANVFNPDNGYQAAYEKIWRG
jgi:ribose transport system substrate-binding protein